MHTSTAKFAEPEVHLKAAEPCSMNLQLCCGPGDETVVSGGYDQAVRVWDMRSRSFDPVQTLKPFADSVTAVLVTQRCASPMSLLKLSTFT